MRNKLLPYIPVLIWSMLIIALSTGPGVQVPFDLGDLLGVDKVGHFTFYAVHAFLLLWAFEKSIFIKSRKRKLIFGFLISALLGISLEMVQFYFYPNRYFEILDIIANISGSLLGMALFIFCFLREKRNYLGETLK